MKSIKKLGLSLMMGALALTVAACSTPAQAKPHEQEIVDEPVKIVHDLGETVLSKKPEKVVVFDYGILDALDTIGEDIVGLPKASLPQYLDKYNAENYVDVGSLKEPNFETIYELGPDLIFISGRQMDLYDEFVKIAPTIYLTIDGENYMDSFKSNMNVIGEVFNKEELLKSELEKIEKATKDVHDKALAKEASGLFIMANDGNLSVFGEGSRFGILYNELGIKPTDKGIEVSSHGDKISFEYIVEKDPDYIYIMDRAAVAGGDVSAKQVMENDLIKSTSAYKNDRITYLDAHTWYVSSGGITGTMKMIEEIQDSLNK